MHGKPLEDQSYRSAKGRKVKIEELFGLILEEAILRRGLSKATVAHRCYISEKILDKLLRGEIEEVLLRLDNDLVHDLAETLDIPAKVIEIILDNIPIEKDYDVVEEANKIIKTNTKSPKKTEHWLVQFFNRNKSQEETTAL